jgi:hypothetical protein
LRQLLATRTWNTTGTGDRVVAERSCAEGIVSVVGTTRKLALVGCKLRAETGRKAAGSEGMAEAVDAGTAGTIAIISAVLILALRSRQLDAAGTRNTAGAGNSLLALSGGTRYTVTLIDAAVRFAVGLGHSLAACTWDATGSRRFINAGVGTADGTIAMIGAVLLFALESGNLDADRPGSTNDTASSGLLGLAMDEGTAGAIPLIRAAYLTAIKRRGLDAVSVGETAGAGRNHHDNGVDHPGTSMEVAMVRVFADRSTGEVDVELLAGSVHSTRIPGLCRTGIRGTRVDTIEENPSHRVAGKDGRSQRGEGQTGHVDCVDGGIGDQWHETQQQCG